MDRLRPWLYIASLVAVLAGYFSAWISHPVAGLMVTGIDLPEYVKFLPAVRAGTITLWREGFYLPPVAVSLILSLFAFHVHPSLPGWFRWTSPFLAIAIASLLLPPAWTPALLLTPEFRLQTAAMLFCWLVAAFSPFVALLPLRLARIIASLLIAAAATIPLLSFMTLLPDMRLLYVAPIRIGWSLYLMHAGLLLLLWSLWIADAPQSPATSERSHA